MGANVRTTAATREVEGQTPARRATTPPHELLRLQRIAGNRAVQHLVAARRPAVQRTPCGDDCACDGCGDREGDTTVARTPDTVVARVPNIYGQSAAGVGEIPEPVLTAWSAALDAGGGMPALQVMLTHLTDIGRVDPARINATAIEGDQRAWCAQDEPIVLAQPDHLGASVATCATGGPGNPPNLRMKVSPNAVDPAHVRRESAHSDTAYQDRRAFLSLRTTLLHEFRHVEQAHQRGVGEDDGRDSGVEGLTTYCNDPDEFDAYLAELEIATADNQFTAARRAITITCAHWPFLSDATQAIFDRRFHRAISMAQIRWELPVRMLFERHLAQGMADHRQRHCGSPHPPEGRAEYDPPIVIDMTPVDESG